MMAAAATEDFSFPSITTNDYSSPPRFIGSPTLWHRSSSCSPSSRHGTSTAPAESKLADQPAHDHDDEINHDHDQQQYYWRRRRSFSYVGRSRGARTPPRRAGIFKEDGISTSTEVIINDDVEEEKMDMLWEDLNELELQSESSCQLDSPGRMANFGCVSMQYLSRSGGGGTVVIGKKPNVRLFVRVLKKIFMLHNSQRSLKKQRTW